MNTLPFSAKLAFMTSSKIQTPWSWMQFKIMMIKNWNSTSGWRKLQLLIWKSTVKKFYILSIYTKFIRMWWFQVRRQRMAAVAPNLLLILYQIKRRKVDKNTLNPKHEHYSAPNRWFGFKLHNCSHAKGPNSNRFLSFFLD